MTPEQIENVKLLVTALRSGEYKQGQGKLCREASDGSKTFCCLGVACEIAAQKGIPLKKELSVENRWYIYARDSRDTEAFKVTASVLPESIKKFFGFTYPAGDYTLGEGGSASLASKNDCGTSFSEIADIIENALKTPGHLDLFE